MPFAEDVMDGRVFVIALSWELGFMEVALMLYWQTTRQCRLLCWDGRPMVSCSALSLAWQLGFVERAPALHRYTPRQCRLLEM